MFFLPSVLNPERVSGTTPGGSAKGMPGLCHVFQTWGRVALVTGAKKAGFTDLVSILPQVMSVAA